MSIILTQIYWHYHTPLQVHKAQQRYLATLVLPSIWLTLSILTKFKMIMISTGNPALKLLPTPEGKKRPPIFLSQLEEFSYALEL